MRVHEPTGPRVRLHQAFDLRDADQRTPRAATIRTAYAVYRTLARTYARWWHGLALPPAVCRFPEGSRAIWLSWDLDEIFDVSFGYTRGAGIWEICDRVDGEFELVPLGRRWAEDPWGPMRACPLFPHGTRPLRLGIYLTSEPLIPLEDLEA